MPSASSRNVHRQVDTTARVTPLVVVPGHHLDEPLTDHGGAWKVDDGAVRIADVVDADELLLAHREHALHCTVCCFAECVVDLFDGYITADFSDEVDDRHIGRRDAHRDPVDLPLQLGNDERRRPGGAGRCGNDRHGGRTCTADVLVRQVEDVLVVRVGV